MWGVRFPSKFLLSHLHHLAPIIALPHTMLPSRGCNPLKLVNYNPNLLFLTPTLTLKPSRNIHWLPYLCLKYFTHCIIELFRSAWTPRLIAEELQSFPVVNFLSETPSKKSLSRHSCNIKIWIILVLLFVIYIFLLLWF